MNGGVAKKNTQSQSDTCEDSRSWSYANDVAYIWSRWYMIKETQTTTKLTYSKNYNSNKDNNNNKRFVTYNSF